jgi:hypothetical protein
MVIPLAQENLRVAPLLGYEGDFKLGKSPSLDYSANAYDTGRTETIVRHSVVYI